MNINKDHLAFLLNAYTNHTITDAELEELTAYVLRADADPVLNELMEDFMDNMKKDANLEVPKEQLYQNITAHPLFKAQTTPDAKIISLRKWRTLLTSAAAVVLITGCALFFYMTQQSDAKLESIAFVQKSNLNGQPVKYTLPDGSEIYLGAGSSIRYPKDFSGETRELDLQGEAFFQVTHNPDRPFIIHTGEINTQVLGTSFKVSAFTNQPVEVAVATGKVGVTRTTGAVTTTLAMLTPGLSITYNLATQKAVPGKVEVYGLQQWKAGDLVFEDEPMAAIAVELQRRYGIKIDIVDKDVADNQVSGTFNAGKSAQQVMKILAIAGKFRFETTDYTSFKIYKTN